MEREDEESLGGDTTSEVVRERRAGWRLSDENTNKDEPGQYLPGKKSRKKYTQEDIGYA